MVEARRKPAAAKAAPDGRDGRVRAVIDALLPAVDGGRFPVKCIAGEKGNKNNKRK